MENLTAQDTEKLLSCIQSIYTFQDSNTFGRHSLAILDRLAPTDASIVINGNANLTEITIQSLDPDFERLMNEDLSSKSAQYVQHKDNRLFQNLSLLLAGRVLKTSDFFTFPELERTDPYQDLIKSIGFDDQICFVLYSNSIPITHPQGRMDHYMLYRSWNSLTERERLLLNLIQPHLKQAFETALHIQQQQQQIERMRESIDGVGIICLTPTGGVEWMTTQAAYWLREHLPSPTRDRVYLPEQVKSWAQHQIKRLKASNDIPPPCLPLRLKQNQRELTIRLIYDSKQEKYLLLLNEEHLQPLSKSLELLGLSPRETEVLAALIQGKNSKDIAKILDITTATARKHIENIYRKLDVQTQTEAVVKALEQLGALSSLPIIW
jgi:DNA-binding CsgD family transcriptional regulator